MQISAVVVTYNDARRLEECLASLRGMDELVVVDLGSSDDSVKIATEMGGKVIHHAHVDAVEEVRPWAIWQASHDWIISPDPDEVLASGATVEIRRLIDTSPRLGRLGLPWPFFLKGRPVLGTLWGRRRHKGVVYHRSRVKFREVILRGIVDKPEWDRVDLPWREDLFLRHYWSDSYRALIAKHLRYARKEGEARYSLGERFTWRKLVREVRSSLRTNLRTYPSPRAPFQWLGLTTLHLGFVVLSLMALRQYQRKEGPS